MEIFKVAITGVVCAVIIVYLKSINSDFVMPATICSGIIILILTLSFVGDFLGVFKDIAQGAGLDSSILKIILKVVAISYLIEFSATLIEDFGLKSIADKVVFAGKILILTLSAPIIENLIKTVSSLL